MFCGYLWNNCIFLGGFGWSVFLSFSTSWLLESGFTLSFGLPFVLSAVYFATTLGGIYTVEIVRWFGNDKRATFLFFAIMSPVLYMLAAALPYPASALLILHNFGFGVRYTIRSDFLNDVPSSHRGTLSSLYSMMIWTGYVVLGYPITLLAPLGMASLVFWAGLLFLVFPLTFWLLDSVDVTSVDKELKSS